MAWVWDDCLGFTAEGLESFKGGPLNRDLMDI